jgi:L-ascorbate metabolism protein UlaG (beta-lactamase superfamily)
MKKPPLQGDAFLADVAEARRESGEPGAASPLHAWWLGQSGFLLLWNGRHVLLDPYLSDSLTRKYASTDKPHVRMTELVVEPRRLDFLDVVTSSHTHTDHLDPETLTALAGVNPRMVIVCSEANRDLVRERSGLPNDRILGIDLRWPTAPSTPASSAGVTLQDLRFHAQGLLLHVGFVIELGPYRVYHSGDTVRFEGMDAFLRPWAVDLALLPINGRSPARRVAGNLDGPEAAQFARDIGARMVVPCHYDMFEFNTASPEPFAEECRRLNQPYRVMEQGTRITIEKASSSPL